MPDESRILALLEEALDSRRTPEEVCADTPELLWEVRQRWERCQDVEAQIEQMFPTTGNAKNTKCPLHLPTTLPVIPGYQINTVLGHGGMGVVYKAKQLKLNRSVALKMLVCGELAGSDELFGLLREAQAVAALKHANIVQVHDVGDLDGLPFFTMEFLEGGSLAQKLAGVPQPARDAASMLVLLARAVAAAHKEGIVHRDLKPSNILLTSDGVPKITDFGLARQLSNAAGFNARAARVGTASYMAPEQALGKVGAFCPAVDVYALGAILYEMLTGRPPFKAETSSETQRQVISQEPVPPQRLNAKIPCDLQTICLKCLRKDPARRYGNAAEFAEDLERFLKGEPVMARPTSLLERAIKWIRREPAVASLLAMVLMTIAFAVSGAFWFEHQKAKVRATEAREEGRDWEAVEAALAHADNLQNLGHWPEARAALEAAPVLLGNSAPPQLRERLKQSRANADTVVQLENVRLRLSEGTQVVGRASPTADRLYTEAFANYGIDLKTMSPADAAAVIRRSQIKDILVVFLHDWLYWVPISSRVKLRELVDAADDDPWRAAFRSARAENDVLRLAELAGEPGAEHQPPALLSGLGGALLADNHPAEAWALLRSAQRRHPEDFWINYLIGHCLESDRPQEAIGYFRAAIAVRPDSNQAYSKLGQALFAAGDADGAFAALQRVVELNPTPGAISELVKVAAASGRLEQARIDWAKVLASDPPDHDRWYGYAQLCLFLGKTEDYRQARDALLNRFGQSKDWIVAERTALAGLLLDGSPQELRPALDLAERSAANSLKSREPNNPYVQFVQGLAEYRQGHFDQAIDLLQQSAAKIPSRPGPRLALAMSQFRSGSQTEALKTLAGIVVIYDWRRLHDDHQTAWNSHVLRREAELMILPNLEAFLSGKYQPRDNDERLALLGICEARGLNGLVCRLFADAIEADPALAESLTLDCLKRADREKERHDQIDMLNTNPRYLAARCAALAGSGLGNDASNVDSAQRARWRKQARDWLSADLAAWKKLLASDSKRTHNLAYEMVNLWSSEPDLADIRDAGALGKLPAMEREEWVLFWNQVAGTLSQAEASK